MKVMKDLNVQCFVKRACISSFGEGNAPQLLYVGKTRPDASAHPRIMHAHPDFVEIVLIVSGSGEYLIHDKKQFVQAGDLLIYNADVVHDEFAGKDVAIGSYCMAVGGIQMPGLFANELVADECGQVFHCGDEFDNLKMLFEMMYTTLSASQPRAEVICHNLMMVILEKALVITGSLSTVDTAIPTEPHELGMRVKDYIDRHFREPITLQSIAKELYMSPYYLAHVFKQMSGYPPIQYLLRRRIGEAQTLLISTESY